jgi:signal transduction histidine kinase
VGAVSEALTNVAKHAGTASAVLRLAATPAALVVTVLDQAGLPSTDDRRPGSSH